MPATNFNRSASNNVFNRLRNLAGGRKGRRKSAAKQKQGHRNLQFEGLENREMFAVYSLWFTAGNVLMVMADNTATSVTVRQADSNIRITDAGTNRSWDYAASSVGRVAFQGGAGSDRFVNYVNNLPVRAMGGAGDDYLEGYDGADLFSGGDGIDTLVGYGGNDQLIGNNGDDILRGMDGDDTLSGGDGNDKIWGANGADVLLGGTGDDELYGELGNDNIDGGADNDKMWGGNDADILLGGIGDDQLFAGAGNDRLNGQAGIDRMWGEDGDDVLIAIDGAYSDIVSGDAGFDTLWIDDLNLVFNPNYRDYVVGGSEIIQRVRSFANYGADKTLDGDNLDDPGQYPGSIFGNPRVRYNNTITAGNTQGSNPLFAQGFPGGPTTADIDQNALGDCWLLSGLGAIANRNPNVIRQNVVDFDDGTYGVRLGNRFYRVDNELTVGNMDGGATSANLTYAKLGAQNSMWVAIVEKAFAHYRGDNYYSGLNDGDALEVFTAFRLNNIGDKQLSTYATGAAMAADLFSKWSQGYAMTIGPIGVTTNGTAKAYHGFIVERFIRDAAGTVAGIVLRNPWATDSLNRFPAFMAADGGGVNDGVFTVTVNQLFTSGGWANWGQV